jgi:hypothetical protein
MYSTPNGLNPEWTQPQMDWIQNRLNSEWTELRMGLNIEQTQHRKGLNPEWAELRMGLNLE